MTEPTTTDVPEPIVAEAPKPKGLIAILCFSQVAAGAFGGWSGDDTLSIQGFLICVALAVVPLSVYQTISWCRFPGRYEDGRLHFRSLIGLVVSVGGLGGIFWGLLLWGIALVAFNVIVHLGLGQADQLLRAGAGAGLGVMLSAAVAWSLLRRKR